MVNNGTLIPNVPIAVDQWRLPKSHDKFKVCIPLKTFLFSLQHLISHLFVQTYLYFLSHLHTDHTQGIKYIAIVF